MLQLHEPLPTLGGGRPFTVAAADEITGVLWRHDDNVADTTDTNTAGSRPLVLLAHGGGQSAQAPNVQARAARLIARGYDAVALDAPGHGGRPRASSLEQAIARMRQAQGDPQASALAVAALNDELSRRAVPEWMALLDELTQAGLRENSAPIAFWGHSLGAAIGFALMPAEPRIRAAVLGLVGDNLAEHARAVTAPIQFIIQWDDRIIARDSALRLFDAIGSHDKTLHANPGDHGDVPLHEHADALTFFERQLPRDV